MTQLNDLAQNIPGWLGLNKKDSDVVISSRIRLARNVKGYPFTSVMSTIDMEKTKDIIHKSLLEILDMEEHNYEVMNNVSPLQQELLVERRIISKEMLSATKGRAFLFRYNEKLSIMINEEDHLRIQLLDSGIELQEIWESLNDLDNNLSQKLEFAFDRRFGYLTSCPTNTGTGLRASVMLHLPALQMTQNIEQIYTAAYKSNIDIRGFQGEGTKPTGDFYQISNQSTLGQNERQIVHNIESAANQIIKQEQQMRKDIAKNNKQKLPEKVNNTINVLKSTEEISYEETMKHLSLLRMVSFMGLLETPSLEKINSLCIFCQKSHLINKYPGTSESIEKKRAKLIRLHFN